MASTVSNGNDCSEKWQRPFTKGKFASTMPAIYNFREFTALAPLTSKHPNLVRSSHVFFAIRIVKGSKKFGISAHLPKEIVDRRKKVLPKFFAAKKAGKSAYFSRAEPDKLFIDGRLFSAYVFLISLPFLNCDGATKLIHAVCIYHYSCKTFSVGSLINSLRWLLF